MKTGCTLTEMAQTLEAQQSQKKDYIADTRSLEMTPAGQLAMAQPAKGITNGATHTFDISPHAHQQIGDRIGIPAKYYERMRTVAPALLQANVNHWFAANPEQRIDSHPRRRARAFLSRRYRRL
ncbi:MAG: DUF932 domain-containing protein, partial [Phormidesmis sp. RL_2_1]|nr:DUF932 domain-containing protein [Phormidesmis sp. RL_2_1]